MRLDRWFLHSALILLLSFSVPTHTSHIDSNSPLSVLPLRAASATILGYATLAAPPIYFAIVPSGNTIHPLLWKHAWKTWACQTATRLPVLISGFARILLHVAVALHHCTASNHHHHHFKTIVLGPACLPLVPALDSSACDTASFSMPPPPSC
ncbi:hypothetical protein COCC4DRAFT_31374 [Bipolaris maydis ATCC 48331]|uniref:Uncharacterized protein n=2 Tax=Cochliobolus heterostrophus TaxID=5016 RepID=M2UHR2_COCH5|nr:uncharacterized protein COCC4DRAFT_31374 [Bipolaris maydis ATCC 48331]EMD87482.1 hypothetical protein COCHEDRAFT_1023569 [Bipolaris maydis C5]KAJ5023237.1 hypothetical protein J3E73DRAFT_338215 [Bipolaris maydis]ENI06681.1 hypothetical protein COCC4DRAFT_31374 [Bipolaris maydis ATCC 48331]KAJ5035267.1 hypothetical protein J3E74DRAFT_398676 [Bipolaris maydis]KAJ5056013.1 hypothetical protein J3E74DRAFT_377115 [Bipolaris maydis]